MDFSGLGWGELVEQRGAGPYRTSTEELAVVVARLAPQRTHRSEILPLPASERGIDRTGCALLRRSMGAWSVPLQGHARRKEFREGTRLTPEGQKTRRSTHPFLRERDRRWPEALPAPLIDKSLLLLSRSLVDDSRNGGHRIRLETETASHEPWNVSKTNTVSERPAGKVGRGAHLLVVLGYALSTENGRREEAKVASLRRVLGLGVRPPGELRVDIDVHGGWVFRGVVLRFFRETVPADALHCVQVIVPKLRYEERAGA